MSFLFGTDSKQIAYGAMYSSLTCHRRPVLLINISIIIPVKNEAHNLSMCLQSIRDSMIPQTALEILVIDNGSTDDTVSIAKNHGAVVHIVPNVTVAELRNFGAERAEGEILAFIDADCTVEPSWVESLTPYISDDSIKVFGSPPGIPTSSSWVQSSWYQIRRKDSSERPVVNVDWLESMNFFVRQDAFKAVGGFDVSLVTCEDYDLCMRLKEFGDIVCDSRIKAIHHGEAKTVHRFYQKERWRGVTVVSSGCCFYVVFYVVYGFLASSPIVHGVSKKYQE